MVSLRKSYDEQKLRAVKCKVAVLIAIDYLTPLTLQLRTIRSP